MIIKKIYLFFFIITLITISYKNIFAAPLCLEEDANVENKEVTNNEESSKENIKSIENKDNVYKLIDDLIKPSYEYNDRTIGYERIL